MTLKNCLENTQAANPGLSIVTALQWELSSSSSPCAALGPGRCSAVRELSLGAGNICQAPLRCQERHSCSDTSCSALTLPWGGCGCAKSPPGCPCSSRTPQPFQGRHLVALSPSPIKGAPALCPAASDVQTHEEPLKPPPRKQQLLFALPQSHYTGLSLQLILCHLALAAEHLISQTPILPCKHSDESVSLLNHYLVKRWWL